MSNIGNQKSEKRRRRRRKKSSEESAKSITDYDEDLALENDDILEELECMICHEYMYPPIKQCSTGHSMCELCFSKVSHCPACKANLGSTRNFALEGIHSKVLVPCKYHDDGCTVLKIGAEIRVHQEFCEHGERPCPLKNSTKCTWMGNPKDLLEHAKENHDQHAPVINMQEVHIKNFAIKSDDGKHFQLVKACNKIFKYCVNLNFSSNIIEWCVQYVGPRNEASNYSYIIKFIDKKYRNTNQQEYTVLATCQPVADDTNIFTPQTTVIVHFERLKEFCDLDNNLYFNFKVLFTKDLDV